MCVCRKRIFGLALAATRAPRVRLMAHDGGTRSTPLLPTSPGHERRPLGATSLLALIFFSVAGGPLGSEGIISAVGPGVGLAALAAGMLLFAVPQAMMTAELSTAFPENGGFSLWVHAAFGPFWALMEAYWSWLSGVVDSALYPVLLYSTARRLLATMGGSSDTAAAQPRQVLMCVLTDSACTVEYGVIVAILLVFATPNVFSSRIVGVGAAMTAVFVMAPYVVLSAVSLPQIDVRRYLQVPARLRWHRMFSILYWSLSGFDQVSSFAGEVQRPSSTFPRALAGSCVMLLACYMVPLAAASGADAKWPQWGDGSLAVIAQRVGGTYLGYWVMLSSIASTWGLFTSELLSDSFQLLGMAEAGLAPRAFAKRSRFGTPLRAITLQLLLVAVLVGLDFEVIMCVDNFFSAAAAALEFAAAIRLRFSRPGLPRPYRVPLGTAGFTLFMLIPLTASLLVMWVTISQSIFSLAMCLGATVAGTLLYLPLCRRERGAHGTCHSSAEGCHDHITVAGHCEPLAAAPLSDGDVQRAENIEGPSAPTAGPLPRPQSQPS